MAKKQNIIFSDDQDFSNVDFSQYAPQNTQQPSEQEEDSGTNFFDTVKAFGEGLLLLPSGIAQTARDTWNEWTNDGRIDVTDEEALQDRAAWEAEKQAYQQKYILRSEKNMHFMP